MINEILIYAGSAVITIWGIAHILASKPVIRGFGDLSTDNSRIITMEWIAEGLTFIFIGFLVFLITLLHGIQTPAAATLCRVSAGMLIVMAILSFFTGARTSIIPMKMCPFIKTTVAILFILGSIL